MGEGVGEAVGVTVIVVVGDGLAVNGGVNNGEDPTVSVDRMVGGGTKALQDTIRINTTTPMTARTGLDIVDLICIPIHLF